jgi:toxin HigB-1
MRRLYSVCGEAGGKAKNRCRDQPLPRFVGWVLDAQRVTLYTRGVIQSFHDASTRKVYDRLYSKAYPRDIQPIALRKLRMLNNARSLQDLRVPPGNRLEKLRGDRMGQHSIRINDQWRVCFIWRGNDAFDVEVADYD